MNRLLAVRIVRTEYKVLYVIVFDAVSFGVGYLLQLLQAPGGLREFVVIALSLCMFLYGARVFRGPDEALEPRRPWWKMTARRNLSVLFAFLFCLVTLPFAVETAANISALVAPPGCGCASTTQLLGDAFMSGEMLLWAATLAFFYINSAARLPVADKLTLPKKAASG